MVASKSDSHRLYDRIVHSEGFHTRYHRNHQRLSPAFRSDCHSQSRLFHLFRVRAWLLPHDSLSQELWKSHRFLPGSFHHLYGILQFLDWSSPFYGPSGRVRFERTASVIRWLSHCPVHGCPCGKSPCGLAEESC